MQSQNQLQRLVSRISSRPIAYQAHTKISAQHARPALRGMPVAVVSLKFFRHLSEFPFCIKHLARFSGLAF